MYSREKRSTMAFEIIEAMQEQYEEDGEEGDFDDGLRYLRDDASDEELDSEHAKWVK